LGATAGQAPAPASVAQAYTYQEGIQAPSADVQAPKKKLNWKHYALAAAVACLALLAAAVVAAVVLMRKPAQANKNPVTIPSEDIRRQEVAQPQAGGQSGQPSQPGAGVVTAPSPEPTATDRKRVEKGSGLPSEAKPGDDSLGQVPPAGPSPSVEPTKPRETHAQAPTAPRDKSTSGGKQASADDNKEKKGKLGGLFKKIGGILKGDDKDKDKKQP